MLALESNSLLVDGKGLAKISGFHSNSPYQIKKMIHLEVWIGSAAWW
jgi:hypothetical protein